MGPQASLELHRRLIKRAAENGAKNGSDFPHIVHFSLPVDDFISDANKTSKALDLIVENLREFTFHEDDLVVLACNTAHLLKDEIEQALNIHLESLIELTTDFVASRHDKIRLLASPTTIRTGLYTKSLSERGVTVLLPTTKQLEKIESTIRSVIAFEDVKPLKPRPVPVLLGCTELSCAFGSAKGTIDPLNILVDTVLPRKEML